MTTLSNIEEYYNTSEYKNLVPLEEFKLICISPFKLVRKIFSSGRLRDIRLQYFGVFEVSTSRIKYSKKQIEENYSNQLISEKRYTERMAVLNSYESKSK